MITPTARGLRRRQSLVDQVSVTTQRAAAVAGVFLVAVVFFPQAVMAYVIPKFSFALAAAAVMLGAGLAKMIASGIVSVPTLPMAVGLGSFIAGLTAATLSGTTIGIAVVGVYGRFGGVIGYLAYVVVFATVALVFDVPWLRVLSWAVIFGAGFVAVYGLLFELALVGSDEIRAREPAAFGSTLGNPNFSAAWLALAAAPLAWALLQYKRRSVRVATSAIALVILVGIYVASSLQGPVAAAAGLSVFAVAWARNRGATLGSVAGRAWATAGVVGTTIIVLTVARVGPLAALSERSLELRRWYWEAGVQMFLTSPLFGVGMDHYAHYYRRFRPAEAIEGFALTFGNDAAHSVPLGMFVSGGVILGLGYLAFVAVTGAYLVHGLGRQEGDRRLLVGAVGGAWLAYQAQSLVSIDVPALAFMHFALAGAVVAASGVPAFVEKRVVSTLRHASIVAPLAAVIGCTVVAAGLYAAFLPLRADLAAAQGYANVQADQPVAAAVRLQDAIRLAPWESSYRQQYGVALADSQRYDEALDVLSSAIERDPGDLSPVITRARVADAAGRDDEALEHYYHALEIEPRHPELKVEVARFALSIREEELAARLLDEVLSIDPSHVEGLELRQSLESDPGTPR